MVMIPHSMSGASVVGDGISVPVSDAGTILDHDRYEVRFVLGEGAFGIVYRGRDAHLQREVAIKIPKIGHHFGKDQFLQEARSAARLRHPGLVTVFDAGVDNAGRIFAVHELVAGHSLSVLASSGKLHLSQAVRLVAEAAEAIHYIHREGFVHRDLKPSNILVDGDGRARVSDFGLALDENALRERAGEISGSPAYMSPEQVRGEAHRLDGRTDIWSLGVILYELLADRRPFNGRDQKEYFDEILNREPKPIRQIDDAIPRPLEEAVMNCLAKPVRERYSTAADFAADLRSWLDTAGAHEKSRSIPSPVSPGKASAPTALAIDPQATTSRNSPVRDAAAHRVLNWTPIHLIAGIMGLGLLLGGGVWAWSRLSNDQGINVPPSPRKAESPERNSEPNQDRQRLPGRIQPSALADWHPLLAKKPLVLTWPSRLQSESSEWDYDEQQQTLKAACSGTGLLQLGDIDSEDFDFTVTMSQTPWTAGAGVFFGYRQLPNDEGSGRRFRCQAIEFVQSGANVGQLAIARSVLTFSGQHHLQMRESVTLESIRPDNWSELTMSIRVRGGRLVEIRLGETQRSELIGPTVSQEFDKRDVSFSGAFGVVINNCTVRFRKAAYLPRLENQL